MCSLPLHLCHRVHEPRSHQTSRRGEAWCTLPRWGTLLFVVVVLGVVVVIARREGFGVANSLCVCVCVCSVTLLRARASVTLVCVHDVSRSTSLTHCQSLPHTRPTLSPYSTRPLPILDPPSPPYLSPLRRISMSTLFSSSPSPHLQPTMPLARCYPGPRTDSVLQGLLVWLCHLWLRVRSILDVRARLSHWTISPLGWGDYLIG